MTELTFPFTSCIERFKHLSNVVMNGRLDVGNADSKDIFVHTPGFLDTHMGRLALGISSQFVANGLNMFSFSTRDPREEEEMYTYGGHFLWMEQTMAAVAFLEEEKGFKVRGLMGHSKGASVALMCTQKRSFDIIINLGSRINLREVSLTAEQLKEVEEKGITVFKNKAGSLGYATREDIEDRFSIDMPRILRESVAPNTKSVLTVIGSDDSMVSIEDCEEIGRQVQHQTLLVLEGARHSLRFYEEEAGKRIAEHIKTVLDL